MIKARLCELKLRDQLGIVYGSNGIARLWLLYFMENKKKSIVITLVLDDNMKGHFKKKRFMVISFIILAISEF